MNFSGEKRVIDVHNIAVCTGVAGHLLTTVYSFIERAKRELGTQTYNSFMMNINTSAHLMYVCSAATVQYLTSACTARCYLFIFCPRQNNYMEKLKMIV